MKSWQPYCEKFKWTYKLWRESDIESIHLKNKKLYDYYKKIIIIMECLMLPV
jgi:hypothetical protein